MQTIDQQLVRSWERLENETDQAWEAFSTYLDLGSDRSLAKTAHKLGKSTPLMEGWSTRHGWQKRVLAYDRHAARITNERIILGTADMRQRNITLAQHVQQKAAMRILSMSDAEIKALTPAQTIAFFKAATDAEIKARMIPDSELLGADRDDAPTFVIQIMRGADEGQVGVRLPDGQAGYIAASEVERFKIDFPEAVILI